jgi:hypothetical protein
VHQTFAQHVTSRLERSRCSHWGSAVYKWEGPLSKGPNAGKTGVLIGETKNLRQRIKQYVSGTQERGNKLWREIFLTQGEIWLYTLHLSEFLVGESSERTPVSLNEALASNNMRLVLEQMLVLREVAKNDKSLWIVNARQ